VQNWQTMMTKLKKRSPFFQEIYRGDKLSCRPGWHSP